MGREEPTFAHRPRLPGPAPICAEDPHAHRSRFSPAALVPGAQPARAGARCRPRRLACRGAVRPPARPRGPLGGEPASLPARGLRRGGRRPHGARPRGVARAGRGGPLPRPPRPPLGGYRPRRRRRRRAVPLRRAPRRWRELRDRGVSPRPAASRSAQGQRLLRLEHLLRGRGGPLRGRSRAARGHGLQRRRRRGRARHLPRARGLRRRLPRAGDRARADRVLWRRDRPRAPDGPLDGADHRRAERGDGLAVPRARPHGRDRRPSRAGAVQGGPGEHQGGRRPGAHSPACRSSRARALPPAALRRHRLAARAPLRRRARGARRAARPL